MYDALLAANGVQGWWPTPGRAGRPGFDAAGYHRGDYHTPRTAADRFEIVMGAVLTQNTAWTNASSALVKLRAADVRLPADVAALSLPRLARLIRSSGYFNQKAKKLKAMAALFAGARALTPERAPDRETLLAQWGVGPETADSILLYAFQRPIFVVDAYTRRILSRIGLISGKEPYDAIQKIFHVAMSPSPATYNEYHALIVEHAKVHCRARPVCEGCPVDFCRSRRV